METTTWILLGILIYLIYLLFIRSPVQKQIEPFEIPTNISTLALDAPPTTSELKNHYKTLLIFIDDDFRKTGHKGLRIAADFRNRVYGDRSFRDNLKPDDILANWPAWLPPLDITQKETVPEVEDAVTAEMKMLAYLALNYPQEKKTNSADTDSTVRNLLEDFGYRFVFKKGQEVEHVAPEFAPKMLLKNWVNPVTDIRRARA